jgi:hypothetical protein
MGVYWSVSEKAKWKFLLYASSPCSSPGTSTNGSELKARCLVGSRHMFQGKRMSCATCRITRFNTLQF